MQIKIGKIQKTRIALIFVVIIIMWLGLLIRGAYLQFGMDDRLSSLREKQFETMVTLRSRRGAIYDRNGNELAATVSSYSLFADPFLLKNYKFVSKKLSPILNVQKSKIQKYLSKSKRRFVWLKRYLSKEDKEKIESLGIEGLGFIEEPKRIYPNNSMMSSTLGFVGSDGQGLEGLEKKYDKYLRGQEVKVHMQRDARGRPLLEGQNFYSQVPDGYDLHLTIDGKLQFMLERELSLTVDQYKAESAVGLILDAKSSEVLAIAQTPTYDANNSKKTSSKLRRNKNIVDSFEPGSTMKTFVIAGVLEGKLAKPNTSINCEGGRIVLNKRVIREAEASHSFDKLSVSEILAYSSNVGAAKLAFLLGEKKLIGVLNNFGFGNLTGIDFIGETKGIIQNPGWNQHLLANVSFGHGMTASPIQIATAYAAIANGGLLTTPRLVSKIISEDNKEHIEINSESKRVLSQETSSTLSLILTQATSDTGTGKNARIKGFPVAGKTGTAQKVDLVHGGYLKNSYISSFAGFVPAINPEFVIYIAVNDPKESYYAAQVAAPVFSRVATFAMRQSGTPPVLITAKDVIETKKSVDILKVDQESSIKHVRDQAELSVSAPIMPELKGLTLREVIRKMKGSGVKIKIHGKGLVSGVVPEPGNPIEKGKEIRVYFE